MRLQEANEGEAQRARVVTIAAPSQTLEGGGGADGGEDNGGPRDREKLDLAPVV